MDLETGVRDHVTRPQHICVLLHTAQHLMSPYSRTPSLCIPSSHAHHATQSERLVHGGTNHRSRRMRSPGVRAARQHDNNPWNRRIEKRTSDQCYQRCLSAPNPTTAVLCSHLRFVSYAFLRLRVFAWKLTSRQRPHRLPPKEPISSSPPNIA